MKNVFEFKLQLFRFKNMEKINSLNLTNPALPNDMWFDDKSKQEIENLFPKVWSTKETVERYAIQQLQFQSQKYQ